MKNPDLTKKKWNIKKTLKAYIEMKKAIIKLGDIEIEKQKFHQHKSSITIKSLDINEIVVSNKVSFNKKGFKYFIGYKDAKIKLLCEFLPKMSTYRWDFNKTKYMPFLIKNDESLEKYNEILEKVKNSIKNKFDSKPIYNEKYLKAKIKSCNGKVSTMFIIIE